MAPEFPNCYSGNKPQGLQYPILNKYLVPGSEKYDTQSLLLKKKLQRIC